MVQAVVLQLINMGIDLRKLLTLYVLLLVLIILITSIFAKCNAQFKLKEHIAPASLVFVAGLAEGVMDGLQFHYDKPNQFWNPDLSWRNKYKNHDPAQGKTFRGKYLVFTTDGWHLMKFTRNSTLFAAFTLKFGEKKKWWVYIVEGLSYWTINRIGFNISYKLF